MAIVCPKCQSERRPGADACPRCGLAVAHWDAFVDEPAPHEALDPAWQDLQSRWEDLAAHRSFLDLAAGCGALDLAAQRYRARLKLHPTDERARAGLTRAVTLAEQLHAIQADRRYAYAPLWLRLAAWLVSGLVVMVFLAGLWFVFRR